MEINIWLGPSCMTRVSFMLETRPWPVVSVLAEGRSPRCYGAWACPLAHSVRQSHPVRKTSPKHNVSTSANTVAELLPVLVSSDHSTSGAFSDSFTSSQSEDGPVPWSCGLIQHLGDRPHPMMQAPTWSSRLRTNLFFFSFRCHLLTKLLADGILFQPRAGLQSVDLWHSLVSPGGAEVGPEHSIDWLIDRLIMAHDHTASLWEPVDQIRVSLSDVQIHLALLYNLLFCVSG